MQNPRLAGRYAKSLIDLAIERNELEKVYADMKYLEAVMNMSKEFVTLLRSPIVTSEKKNSVITAITTGKVSQMTATFNKLLVSKGREIYLDEIVAAFIGQYNSLKGIFKVKLTTAVEVGEKLKSDIINKLKQETSIKQIELETKVKEDLIGGFVLEFNNNLVDASVLRDLRDVKAQFDKNVYEMNIR